ncbi:MAG: efflux RND transporter periplasmic adaptor subunit [Rhodobacter sp.]|nr:efflux RND transporter periplasmic adaptor subunit [Rhodobacter sp.]
MKRLQLLLLVLATAHGAAGLESAPAFAQTEPVAPKTMAPALPAITVSTVSQRVLRDRVIGSGLVTPVERVLVQPLIEGQPIESLEVEVGDIVTKGQVLARLSSSTLMLQQSQLAASRASAVAAIAQAEAQLLEAKSASDEATRINERTQQLRAQGSSSQAAADTASSNAISAAARVTVAVQGLEAAKAQLALVDAQIEDVKLQLSRTEVVAPVAGEIVVRSALVGSIATAQSEPMFAIIRDNELELRADFAERFMLKIKPGQKVLMRGVGQPASLTGTVRLVEPAIAEASRLGQARVTIDDPTMVRTGMFMDAEVLVAERETLAVPVTAVGASDTGATLMRVTDGLVARVPVELGIRDGSFVEVLSGVAAGDLIVTKAAAFVREGDKINPVPDSAGTN